MGSKGTQVQEATSVDEFRSRARAWLAANAKPWHSDSRRGSREGGEDDSPERWLAARAMRRRIYEAGFAGITWPRKYGGQGLSDLHEDAWAEEASGYQLPNVGGAGLGVVGPTLLVYGTEGQKRAWLPKILSGEEAWVQFLSEPSAGSDLAGILTRAVRDGEGWVLTGAKIWSTGAIHCDAAICLARTDWDAPKHKGLTWFKVHIPSPGLTIRPIREINGGAEFCEEFLDGVWVPADNVIGEVNGGWPLANVLLAHERRAAGRLAVRISTPDEQRSLAPDLVALARRGGVLGTEHARQLVARAHVNEFMHAQLIARISTGALGAFAPSLGKLSTGILNPIRAVIGMQLAGAGGVAWEPDDSDGNQASTAYLNGRIMSIAGGSNQVQRNIISERILGLPREPSYDSQKPFKDVLRDARNWSGTS
jgi:alkylation response protein AidB-like acyl-CoA dehydrogenase